MAEVHKVGPFILGKLLGTGTTGTVRLAFHKDNGQQVAIKIVDKTSVLQNAQMEKKLQREIAVMKLVRHPHVLQLYDVYETDKHLFLVLEHAPGGELFDYLVAKGALDTTEALKFFQQIVEGLHYCHQHYICHRDLKPENLLMDCERQIKLADFGMASLRKNSLSATSCGSPHYASPEVVMGAKYDGLKADVWSCGVILFALVSGKLPFDDENIRKLLQKVKSGVYHMPTHLHANLQDLIKKMLTLNPDERISLAEVRQHPWYTQKKLVDLPETENIDGKQAIPISDPSQLDPSIMKTLQALDLCNSERAYHEQLTSNEPTFVKTVYRLLEERKSNPPKEYRIQKKLERVVSDPKLEKKPENKKKRLQRRRSMGSSLSPLFINPRQKADEQKVSDPRDSASTVKLANTPQLNTNAITANISNSNSKEMSASPRRSWLTSLLNRSKEVVGFGDKNKANANKILSDFGFNTNKNFEQVTNRLKRALEVTEAVFTVSSNATKFRGKVSQDAKTVRFDISIIACGETKEKEPLHYIRFHRKGGDKIAFATFYNIIRAALKSMIHDQDNDEDVQTNTNSNAKSEKEEEEGE